MALDPAEAATLDEAAVEARFAALSADDLELLIRRANTEYWERNEPTFSDPLYDRLVEALRRIRPDSSLLDELGEPVPEGEALEVDELEGIDPAERFGAPVRHRRPMLSLDKCYGPEDLESWASKFEGDVVVMPKMDGIACSILYGRSGRLVVAATRGSGTVGEDITANVLNIEDVPNELDPQSLPEGTVSVEVRGEIFMKLSVFAAFSDTYSNPRNLTAGAVKNKNFDRSKSYRLSFYPYDIHGTPLPTENEKFALLERLGFEIDGLSYPEREHLQGAFDQFTDARPDLDYEIDGVVYRACRVDEQDRLGSTSHHPRWSIAYKFQGDTGITTLNDVEWSISRTGTVTPVARFEPIELSGAKISRASLHNFSRFLELGLSKGAKVEVTRRGGVIPMLERVVEPGAEPFEAPSHCPACGHEIERVKDRDAEFLRCSDAKNCVPARLGELEHFAKVVDIQGFGTKIISAAYEAGFLRTPVDYFTLTTQQLETLERLGRKSAQNLVDQVDAHRDIELATFLRALGIDHLGPSYAKMLANEFRTLEAVRNLDKDALLELKGVQDAIADALIAGLASRKQLIDDLLEHVTVIELSEEQVKSQAETEAAKAEGALAGKSFLFTGALEHFDRKTAQAKVDSLGGKAASGVSKTLDFLVIGGDGSKKSSKQKKAEALIEAGAALKILTEDEFRKMIGEA